MQPKRGSLPLLFILTFSAIFLYSYHYHFSQSQSLTLHLPIPRNPNPNFTFTIKVLTFDRLPSLRRCLLSLANALYSPSDHVNLHIFVDHFPNSSLSIDSIDKNLENSHQILEFVDNFKWIHGEKVVHYRTGNAGLQAQWLEAWWPKDDDAFAFIVEDDLEVSPLYYRFLKELILKYYYDEENHSPDVYGASLQRPRFVAGKHGNKLQVDKETHLFLYQMVGTWGQLLFPKPWKEFRLWYDAHKARGIKPILQGMVTTGWYKKMGDRIWTPWFIKFIHSRGYYNIYTNFQQEKALSTSHRDPGVNYGKTAGPDSKLLDEGSLDFNLWEFQPLRNLKRYDFCFSEVIPRRVISSIDEFVPVLDSLQKQKPVIFVSLFQTTEKIARNLICHLERLSVQNFVFIGGSTGLLHDFARRGYPVIDSRKEMWIKARVVRICLEFGYDCWMIDGNIVPSSNIFTELLSSTHFFSAARYLEMMFVKSSPTSLKTWDDNVVSKLSDSASLEHRNFAYFATKALEDGSVKVWRFDDSTIGAKIGEDSINGRLLEGKKLVFWSTMRMDSVQRDLEKLDMWLIDGDLSCTSVVCHR